MANGKKALLAVRREFRRDRGRVIRFEKNRVIPAAKAVRSEFRKDRARVQRFKENREIIAAEKRRREMTVIRQKLAAARGRVAIQRARASEISQLRQARKELSDLKAAPRRAAFARVGRIAAATGKVAKQFSSKPRRRRKKSSNYGSYLRL